MSRAQAGFSMVEMMIVLLIISLLAAIATPLYHQMTYRAIASEGAVNLNYLLAEESAYFQVNDKYGSFTDMGMVWTGAAVNPLIRFSRGGAVGGGGHGGWVPMGGSGGGGSGGSGGSGGGGSSTTTDLARPADSEKFTYSLTLSDNNHRVIGTANYADGFATVLLTFGADRGKTTDPIKLLLSM